MLQILLFLVLTFSPLLAEAPSPNNHQDPMHHLELLAQKEDTGTSKFMEEMLNMFIVLGGIVGVMLVVSWALKKLLNTKMLQINQTSGIKIIEKRAISPKVHIYLLNIRGKGFVIAESPQGVHGLGDFLLNEDDLDEEPLKEDVLESEIKEKRES